MVPVMTKAAASWPQRAAISRSNPDVVSSSLYTSSLRVAFVMASSMPSDGVVTTSPGEVHVVSSVSRCDERFLTSEIESSSRLFGRTPFDRSVFGHFFVMLLSRRN